VIVILIYHRHRPTQLISEINFTLIFSTEEFFYLEYRAARLPRARKSVSSWLADFSTQKMEVTSFSEASVLQDTSLSSKNVSVRKFKQNFKLLHFLKLVSGYRIVARVRRETATTKLTGLLTTLRYESTKRIFVTLHCMKLVTGQSM
jgi:hypothetical protein